MASNPLFTRSLHQVVEYRLLERQQELHEEADEYTEVGLLCFVEFLLSVYLTHTHTFDSLTYWILSPHVIKLADHADSQEIKSRVFYGGKKTEHQKELESGPVELASTLIGTSILTQ